MKAAFRLDASVRIGTGHLARCLALANQLRQHGVEQTLFICRELAPLLAEQIRSQNHGIVQLPAPTISLAPRSEDVAHTEWLSVTPHQDAEESASALGGQWDFLVMDHYGIDHRWQRAMRTCAQRLIMIDDLADRTHDCDMLLDQNVYAMDCSRYAGRIPPHCDMLLGPRYALLRPDFAMPTALTVRGRLRLNLLMGGTDPDGATLWALAAIAPLCGAISVDVIAGAANPHLHAIRKKCTALPSVTLYVQPSNMAELFDQADLAIGAGGSAALERCSRGLPQILMSFADNQRATCAAFARAGVAVNLGDMKEIDEAMLLHTVTALLAAPTRLAEMRNQGRLLVDGHGAARVAATILESVNAKR